MDNPASYIDSLNFQHKLERFASINRQFENQQTEIDHFLILNKVSKITQITYWGSCHSKLNINVYL